MKCILVAILAFSVCAAFAEEKAKPVKVGDPLPDLSAPDESGAPVKLNQFKDKSGLVIFFFPKAFTPGCTKESCGFRDEFENYKEKGYTVFGASRDDPPTLTKFKAEYKLSYSLLSDPNGDLATALGITPGKRETIVIGKDGKVEKIQKAVDASTHFKELLKDLKL